MLSFFGIAAPLMVSGWAEVAAAEQDFYRVFLRPHRPLKNTSDISLMDVTQNDWEDDEPSDAKRFRVRRQKYQG